MRIFLTIIFYALLAATCGEPEPKKFNKDMKDRDKKTNNTLTEEERKFLREVEAKFGVKTELSNNKAESEDSVKQGLITPFPAVIAIEIVNDTDITSKDKRTIDANLGYGYKTNNGYSYSYFGKPVQEKGKFMIYPYSQEDIPASANHDSGYDNSGGRYTSVTTNVEIQPSRAFELVTVKDDANSYPNKKPGYNNHYFDNIKGVESLPPVYSPKDYANNIQTKHGPTLYTTYNGERFSGLSGQFPMVMSNYFINPSQLLKQPEYQNAGLTTDHLTRLQGSSVAQGVVPVLVLRIPSSSLKNPTAELFANLPENYPLSRYLNNVNLQDLVNQYFKKSGYPFAPQLMTYQDTLRHKQVEQTTSVSVLNNEPQNYAAPYVQPSYTHADYSGVQYSAVKPVMARYPSSYTRQRYYPSQGHVLYHQPMHQPRYEYRYAYGGHSPVSSQEYYVQPQYKQLIDQATSQEVTADNSPPQETNYQDSAEVQYDVSSHSIHQNTATKTSEYRQPHVHVGVSYERNTAMPEYGVPKEHAVYEQANGPVYEEASEEPKSQEFYTNQSQDHKDTVSVYQKQREEALQNYYSQLDSGETQAYTYPQQPSEHATNDATETYPSTINTVATVLPLTYKSHAPQPSAGAVQTVSYVTPMPYSYKYQSPYRVMVPQTYLKNPVTEKVSYVNSQSMVSSHAYTGYHQEHNPEEEYTVSSQYIPPVGKQKPPTHPRNYHSYRKRMVRPENVVSSITKKQNERGEKTRS